MVKKNSWESYKALPFTGFIILIISLVYWKNDPTAIGASVFASLFTTLTPITIIFGAILFNKFMEASGAIVTIKRWLGTITPNPTAQLMIIGWAFAFMIEGASGFGTPAAIAAPLLVSLGFKAIPVAILTLIMNSVPVSFGAVGTPTWYGFSQVSTLDIPDFFLTIGIKTSLLHLIAAFIIPVMALYTVVSWSEIKRNIIYVYLSIFACVIPYWIISQWSDEFPSLIGGAVGMLISVFLAKAGVGLAKETEKSSEDNMVYVPPTFGEIVKALTPFAILIGILVLTRLQQLPFKGLLSRNNLDDPLVSFSLGFMDFKLTNNLTFNFLNIFGTSVSDKYQLLYVPALIPFVITVLIATPLFKLGGGQVGTIFKQSASAVKLTYVALFGAFVMVKLMTLKDVDNVAGGSSMVNEIGVVFSSAFGSYWVYFASFLGAIGSFFSGSNTVSNLTFGSIQQSIALSTGLSSTTMLAAQSVGGAMGNMICLNNIIAVCSVTGIKNQEGYIIKKTIVPCLVYGLVVAVALFVFMQISPDFWATPHAKELIAATSHTLG